MMWEAVQGSRRGGVEVPVSPHQLPAAAQDVAGQSLWPGMTMFGHLEAADEQRQVGRAVGRQRLGPPRIPQRIAYRVLDPRAHQHLRRHVCMREYPGSCNRALATAWGAAEL
jgi:hypothetical protein